MNGLNLRANIWYITNASDDIVAGAVLTGTLAYHDVPVRIEEQRVTQVILEQGLETAKLYDCVLQSRVIIHERDEVEVTKPSTHRLFGKRLRAMVVQHDSLIDPRAHQECVLRRVEP